MNKKILYIILAILIFVLGVSGGIFLGNNGFVGGKNANFVIKNLSSKVFYSIAAYGVVEAIRGESVILSNDGDTIDIKMADNIKIYKYENAQKKEARFPDIKIGDRMNIAVTISPKGEIEGVSGIILGK